MKYWLLAIKSVSPVEAPQSLGLYLSKEEAEKDMEMDMEVFGTESNEYEVAEVFVELSVKR